MFDCAPENAMEAYFSHIFSSPKHIHNKKNENFR